MGVVVTNVRSSRTYVGGGAGEHGHLPLPEARRWALAQVEAAEEKFFDAQREYDRAVAERTAAIQRATRCEEQRDAALAALDRAREDLGYRMGPEDDLTREQREGSAGG